MTALGAAMIFCALAVLNKAKAAKGAYVMEKIRLGIIGIGIGKGEVAVALQAAGDERRLHAAQNVHDPAFIDVARDLPARLFFGGELRELPVLQERDELLPAISIEKPFLLHLAS